MIPIIGEPKVTSWALTLQIICPCGTALLLIGTGGMIANCPQCETKIRVDGGTFTDTINLDLAVQRKGK